MDIQINIYTILITIVIIILVTMLYNYVIKPMINNINKKEGLTNRNNIDKDKIPDAVEMNVDKISDSLLISKYRSSYEDTIIQLEQAIGLSLLQQTIENAESISKNPISKKSQEMIEQINSLKTFRETLNEAMDILDKSK